MYTNLSNVPCTHIIHPLNHSPPPTMSLIRGALENSVCKGFYVLSYLIFLLFISSNSQQGMSQVRPQQQMMPGGMVAQPAGGVQMMQPTQTHPQGVQLDPFGAL